MNTLSLNPPAARFLIMLAALVVLLAGLWAAAPVVGPLLLSFMVTIVIYPAYNWMLRKSMPHWAAMLIMVVCVLLIGVAITALFYLLLHQVMDKLPDYREQYVRRTETIQSWLAAKGIDRSSLLSREGGTAFQNLARRIAEILVGSLKGSFFVLAAVIAWLSEAQHLKKRIDRITRADHPLLIRFAEFSRGLQKYAYIKTIDNLLAGAAVTVLLLALKADFALLWGLLVLFLGYVPQIGIVLAIVPPAFLVLIQFGAGKAAILVAGTVIINFFIEQAIESRSVEQRLNISKGAMIILVILWTFILGPYGPLLAVPLTLLVKLLFQMDANTRWIAVIISSKAERDAVINGINPEKHD